MSDLKNFYNLYTALSQSAYEDRPYNFFELLAKVKNKVELDYSKDYQEEGANIGGGKHLPNDGILYVHKDTSVAFTSRSIESMDGDKEQYYKKGLLSDEREGFNSYFLTDTPELSKDTKNAYLAVKGSDGPAFSSANDWGGNNYPFTMRDAYTNQGKLVEEALHVKLAELREKAPNAKLNITGHSLGSIASVQGVAHLSVEELEQIGEIVVFNGPDTLKSLRDSGVSEEVIQILNEKVTYYVNPFDIVSMLNRNTDEQLGKVKVIVPFNFTTTFDNPNSHDFGEYRIHSNGKILEATEDFFPDYLYAGRKLSSLIDKYLTKIKNRSLVLTILDELSMYIQEGIDARYGKFSKYPHIYQEFMKEYKAIVDETKQAVIAWGHKNIPNLQSAIQGATGAKKIELRSRLLLCIAHLSRIESEDKVKQIKSELEKYQQQVREVVDSALREVNQQTQFLGRNEIDQLVSDFQFSNIWNGFTHAGDDRSLNKHFKRMNHFSDTLFYAIEILEKEDDAQRLYFEDRTKSMLELHKTFVRGGMLDL